MNFSREHECHGNTLSYDCIIFFFPWIETYALKRWHSGRKLGLLNTTIIRPFTQFYIITILVALIIYDFIIKLYLLLEFSLRRKYHKIGIFCLIWCLRGSNWRHSMFIDWNEKRETWQNFRAYHSVSSTHPYNVSICW